LQKFPRQVFFSAALSRVGLIGRFKIGPQMDRGPIGGGGGGLGGVVLEIKSEKRGRFENSCLQTAVNRLVLFPARPAARPTVAAAEEYEDGLAGSGFLEAGRLATCVAVEGGGVEGNGGELAGGTGGTGSRGRLGPSPPPPRRRPAMAVPAALKRSSSTR
jgi:hypothetical protein